MRIISKYSDYYDSVMRSGYDPTLIFKREGAFDDCIESYVDFTESYSAMTDFTERARYLGKKLNPEYFDYGFHRNRNKTLHNGKLTLSNSLRKHSKKDVHITNTMVDVIGFCGKFYVIYKICYNIRDRQGTYRIVDKNDKLFQRLSKKEQDSVVINEVPDLIRGNAHDIFLYLDCPIFHLRDERRINTVKITRNPILKDLGFPAILDPYTAYQELSMYIGSVFAPSEPEMVDISDKDLSNAKGFDDYSFKKCPTKGR